MPTEAWFAKDFLGLTPAVDPRRSDKFFALNGSNYVFDSKGPRSDFGNRYLTPYPLGAPQHVQGFRLKLYSGDRVFTMTGDSILEWSETLGGWKVIWYTGNTGAQPFRWTRAYLNGRLYFCHPATGILVYHLEAGVFEKLAAEGMPNQPLAICTTNGRLCAIDEDFFYFSGTSDGRDWTPRIGGAGFVRISDRVSGFPLMITDYAEGALVWTTGGVMRAEFTGDQVVFRTRPVNTELRPINSFCTAKIDDETVIILDERGLFQSKGGAPTPFSPLFNEYLLEYIQRFNLRLGQNLRIEWDELQRRLYLSVSLSYESAIYESAFVLYPSVDKWGQFNEAHYGILPLRIEAGSRQDDYYGFVDSTGRVRYWDQLGTRETLPSSAFLNSVYPVIQKPSQRSASDGGWIVSSSATASPIAGGTTAGHAGYYGIGGGVNAPATLTGLSASVQLGLLRFDTGESVDQMTEVLQLSLGNVIEGTAQELSQGFSLAPVSEAEAFGLNPPNFVNCQIRVISTNDGVSISDSAVPQLTEAYRAARHYSCSTQGIWHILELKAEAPGEAFRLSMVGMTAAYAGKVA